MIQLCRMLTNRSPRCLEPRGGWMRGHRSRTGLSHTSQDLVFVSPPFLDATSGEDGLFISGGLLGHLYPFLFHFSGLTTIL